MNKGQLIEAVQKKLGKDTTKAAADAVNAVFASITKAVKKDKACSNHRVWNFFNCEACRSQGNNPQTGEKIKIKASKSVKFKPGAKLKQLSNCF